MQVHLFVADSAGVPELRLEEHQRWQELRAAVQGAGRHGIGTPSDPPTRA